jgi:signal transduction histidine kinase
LSQEEKIKKGVFEDKNQRDHNMDYEREFPNEWHLIWIVPVAVIIAFVIWELFQNVYLGGPPIEEQYLEIVQAAVLSFIATFITVYIVIMGRRRYERELQRAYMDLKELDEFKNNFLSNISHELRTPLTTISGYTKFILGGKAGEVPLRVERYLRIMSDEADRLEHHIDELLLITTLESKKLALKKEKVNMKNLIDK